MGEAVDRVALRWTSGRLGTAVRVQTGPLLRSVTDPHSKPGPVTPEPRPQQVVFREKACYFPQGIDHLTG